MLESDWLTNILRCAVIFRAHCIACPYHFAKWF